MTAQDFDPYQEQHDDGSIVIDPAGVFQFELQKVVVTEQTVEQLKQLRQMLLESLSVTPVNSKDTVASCLDLANKQGQLVVLEILINSKRIISAKYGE